MKSDKKEVLKVLIVDDEKPARENLLHLLKRHSDFEVIGQCADGPAAVKSLRSSDPDVVFLDVQMPGMDGFEVIRTIGPDNMPLVVFVTAYDRYALQAFEADAVDYLLKPFSDDRFDNTLKRVRVHLAKKSLETLSLQLASLVYPHATAPTSVPRQLMERFSIRLANKTIYLSVEEIDWIDAASYYVRLHVQKKTYLLRTTMDQLESRLERNRFIRIHRSILVNRDRVREMKPASGGGKLLVLTNGTELPVSRRRVREVKQQLRSSDSVSS